MGGRKADRQRLSTAERDYHRLKAMQLVCPTCFTDVSVGVKVWRSAELKRNVLYECPQCGAMWNARN